MEDILIIRNFLDLNKTKDQFKSLVNEIAWHEELTSTLDGSKVKINRKMAYVSDIPTKYTYANLEFPGEVWNKTLIEIRDQVNKEMKLNFNSVLLNWYKDGKDEIKWHSDKEEIIGPNPIIACINLGATRKFWFRQKVFGSEKFFHNVNDGDLLIMGDNCQANYLHAILKEKEVLKPRISLTFRKVFN